MSDSSNAVRRRRNTEVVAAAVLVVIATGIDLLTGTYHAMLLVLGGIGVITVRAERRNKRLHGELRAALADDWAQAQHMNTLLHLIRPVAPLPTARDWAASPDFLSLIAAEVIRKRPAVVVEASCGLSSLVIGYLLQAQRQQGGEGRCIALEEDADYARACREQIALHGLSDVVEVVHAPIDADPASPWYGDTTALDGLTIDLLVVDGPSPSAGGTLPRAPAVDRLRDRLAADATILLDDGDRQTECQTVEQWTNDAGLGLVGVYVPLEKGAWRVSRELGTGRS